MTSEALSWAERAVAWMVRQHFRIPPFVFWLMLVGGAVLAPFLSFTPALVAVAVAAMGGFGVLRWRWHKRRTRLVVVARPVTVDPSDRIAERAQELLLEGLAARLAPHELMMVHTIPARVGPSDVALADAIRKRLGALMIVVGRIERRADGGWSLVSGIVHAPDESLTHIDWHTRERLPARTQWAVWLERLTPTRDVQDVQDPLLLTGEVGAVVRSFAGRIAALADDPARAEAELRGAIDASDDSDSAVIDQLRCYLANVLAQQDRRSEAVELLRARAARITPSAELLRTFARFLGPQPGDFTKEEFTPADPDHDPPERQEALRALRAAAEVRADPKRAMTLYNLAMLLKWRSEDWPEAQAALEESMRLSRYYQKAWYARKARGAFHWEAGRAAHAAGEPDKARSEFGAAALWYSRALRTRPHFRIWLYDHQLHAIRPFARFRGSAVLHANAADAHHEVGHRLRATWHFIRSDRLRRMRMKRAAKCMDKDMWDGAYANFDFAIIGRDDDLEARAEVMRSIALHQFGEPDVAAAAFASADRRFPHVALIIRHVVQEEKGHLLPYGVPSGGPSDEQGVAEELRRRGFLPEAD